MLRCVPVADSAGANVLVAALAALRDCSSTLQRLAAVDELAGPAAAGGADAGAAAAASPVAAADNAGAAAAAAATRQLFSGVRARLQQLGSAAPAGADAPPPGPPAAASLPVLLLDAAVLVSPAMDLSATACFHDKAWTATHEAR